MHIIQTLKEDLTSATMLQQMTKEFMQHFFSVYDNNIASPYMHIFVAHIHEFKKIHSIINAFNFQGLEKLNDLTTSQFFRATNKKTKRKYPT